MAFEDLFFKGHFFLTEIFQELEMELMKMHKNPKY
ncbi:hypothetical protein P872_24400 [Rhodonellum psychrophilum GCM71 = DSM 17998]|uniref:Uncharacterized protein n=1 Tax=Rhodonellum psychrophilum GCM71 = DSM 17998 TaxID=1123057 RepID=U5C3C3_9BACT|nr:hypothetical protein P872_24400 [Rhodonellum psychrophilum GCM71 = DSM 17998]